jgi:D-glycero-D-manno-heptose 1,7-bisphosphate phosphatase
MGVDAMMPPAVFLDRDGVLNRAIVRDGKPYPPASLAELEITPGAARALPRLKAAGYRLIVVTNQPDVAAGRQRRDVVESINTALSAALPIDEVRVCYHDDAHRCSCRKPAPGLLTQPPLHDLPSSIIVGDRWRDIEAGQRANLRATVLIEGHYDERYVTPHHATDSIEKAVDWILALPALRTA